MRHHLPRTSALKQLLALSVALAAISVGAPAPVSAAIPAPHWSIVAEAWPTHFKAGDKGDQYAVFVANDGSRPTNGTPVTVKLSLPAGMTPTNIEGHGAGVSCDLGTVTCVFATGEEVLPRTLLRVLVTVDVPLGAVAPVESFATVSGGDAHSASTGDPTNVSPSPVPFGLSDFSTELTDVGGSAETQAGGHPFEITTRLAYRSDAPALEIGWEPSIRGVAKDIEASLPPGLVGDPNAVPKCSQAMFKSEGAGAENCPADTQVGQISIYLGGLTAAFEERPVYNIEPPAGQPAELGFAASTFLHIPMFFRVRNDDEYGLTAQLRNIPEVPLGMSTLHLWGIPSDHAHDAQRRGPECFGGCAFAAAPRPFLSLPTSCQAAAPTLSLATDPWGTPGRTRADGTADLSDPNWSVATASLRPITGCEHLRFTPSVEVAPETAQAGAPTGYLVKLHIPQTRDPAVLSTPSLRNAAFTLPAGTVVSPSAANGLEGCSDAQFGLRDTGRASCPPASQIGTVRVKSPLLSDPLEGQVFVGQPNCGPCSPSDAQEGRMVRLLMQVQGSGVIVKLAGTNSVNQSNGQLTTTFQDNPQLPFSDLELALNGGARAPLVNPARCGPAVTTTDLTPWSAPATPDATPSSSFDVSGCPSAIPFAPAFSAGTVKNDAAGFSALAVRVARADGEQTLSGITVKTPPGLLGMLSRITLCEEPQAAQGACPAASQIGHVLSTAGPGPSPVSLPQAGKPEDPVFLTGPYRGAPFGLAIVVPAEAGPFNLGTVLVRAAVGVDPTTSQVIVSSDPLPQTLDGIPLQARSVDVIVDREGFIFNPTNCEPLSVTGTITSAQGASAAVSSHFQAANCAKLPFKPKFAASTGPKASRANGVSLDVKVGYPRGVQANIRKVTVDLPKDLPARLTTIRKACVARVFAANPAACPVGSRIGMAIARSPVLNAPLTGPAFLVSHGGAAFPDLTIVLQGQGVTLELVGSVFIAKKGITKSSFANVPDAPVSSFELKLPQGPSSALTVASLPRKAHGSLCHTKLVMPTTINAQNGAVIRQSTKVTVAGCAKSSSIHGKQAHAHAVA